MHKHIYTHTCCWGKCCGSLLQTSMEPQTASGAQDCPLTNMEPVWAFGRPGAVLGQKPRHSSRQALAGINQHSQFCDAAVFQLRAFPPKNKSASRWCGPADTWRSSPARSSGRSSRTQSWFASKAARWMFFLWSMEPFPLAGHRLLSYVSHFVALFWGATAASNECQLQILHPEHCKMNEFPTERG